MVGLFVFQASQRATSQAHLPALAELSMLYLNFVTVAQLERNPTIKDEIRDAGSAAIFPPDFSVTRRHRLRTSRPSRRRPYRLANIRLR
ncbi:hypothetical protein ACM25N_12190 [Roseovarius sp. C7]|uniref:hypothetical protein n=1 Tax=Roseovarius sp. C7 TaxID=3398643 RepID=UPI0039F72229